MRNYVFASARQAFLHVGTELIWDPEYIVSPRGQQTNEIRNATIEITNPADCTMIGMIGRRWSASIAVAEALQLIGGFSDPAVMLAIAPKMTNFLEPSGTFWGLYGERTGSYMEAVVRKLQEDPNTRQAVLAFWSNLRDNTESGKLDYPCTVAINFSIRDDELLMSTHMRSNDIWWGFCYDVFQFTQLGFTVANFLGLPMGKYTHYVDSLHLYEQNREMFEEVADKNDFTPNVVVPELRGLERTAEADSWVFMQQTATDLFREWPVVGENATEKWMIEHGRIGEVYQDVHRED